MAFRHRVFKTMDRRGFRFLLSLLGSLLKSARYRRPCWIAYRDGVWIHRHPDGSLVEPRISLWTIAALGRLTSDHFMYAYTPGPGDVVVDVGAGSGCDTLAFARQVGPTGLVIAVEAHPLMFRCLQEMCRLNRLDNVLAVHAAVGPSDGDVLISDTDDYQANHLTASRRGQTVPGFTLDSIVKRLGLNRIDLLKMNIEGAEGPALSGMTRTIEMTHHVAISCHDFLADWGKEEAFRTRRAVEEFLALHGFRLRPRADSREWVRDCVYADWTGIEQGDAAGGQAARAARKSDPVVRKVTARRSRLLKPPARG